MLLLENVSNEFTAIDLYVRVVEVGRDVTQLYGSNKQIKFHSSLNVFECLNGLHLHNKTDMTLTIHELQM